MGNKKTSPKVDTNGNDDTTIINMQEFHTAQHESYSTLLGIVLLITGIQLVITIFKIVEKKKWGAMRWKKWNRWQISIHKKSEQWTKTVLASNNIENIAVSNTFCMEQWIGKWKTISASGVYKLTKMIEKSYFF